VSARTLITGVTVWDGTGAAPRENAAVLVDDGRITAVDSAQELSAANDVEIVDGDGAFVMPGLVNMHVHLTFMYLRGDTTAQFRRSLVDLVLHATRICRVLLAQGITTARDMGGPDGVPLAIRDAVAAGQIPGPRLVVCGRPISTHGGHAWPLCVEASGPDAFREAARGQLKAGADFVKVMASHDPWRPVWTSGEYTRPELDEAEARAAYAVAESWGAGTACHVMGSEAIGRVLRAGARILDHGQYLTSALAEEMARLGASLVPTLSSYDRQTMHPRFERGPVWNEEHQHLLAGHAAAMRAALGAGVRLLVGTDSVGAYAEEVELLRAAGASPTDSLLACTRWPAEALGLGEEIGTLAPGHAADLVLLDHDPLLDPRALESVSAVMKGGELFSPSTLTSAEGRDGGPGLDELARCPEPTGALT
jgi:imidazolonepropionase-like amidohydrolase